MSIGVNDSVLVEAADFIYVIEEFCVYLFLLMAAWLFFLGIAHYTRVFSYKRHLKSFYKGLAKIGNKTLFTEYVSGYSNRVKHLTWRNSTVICARSMHLGLSARPVTASLNRTTSRVLKSPYFRMTVEMTLLKPVSTSPSLPAVQLSTSGQAISIPRLMIEVPNSVPWPR